MSSSLEKIRQYGLPIYLSGTTAQILAEGTKALLGSDLEKFPNGLASINPIEESLEGGVSASAGAVIGFLLYKRLVATGKIEESDENIQKSLLYGGVSGYCSMAFVAGPLLHSLTGTADVKWGPFS